MVRCSVLGCESDENIAGVTFHPFPTNQTKREMWALLTGRQDWVPSVCDYICSKHFNASCFYNTLGQTCLKAWAMPTLQIAVKVTADPIEDPLELPGGDEGVKPDPDVEATTTPTNRRQTIIIKKQRNMIEKQARQVDRLNSKCLTLKRQLKCFRTLV